MNRSMAWLLLLPLLLPAPALASTGRTPGASAPRQGRPPVVQLAGTTVHSGKSNSSERTAPPEVAPAATTVKSSKSNSNERMAPPEVAPAATTVKASKSNSSVEPEQLAQQPYGCTAGWLGAATVDQPERLEKQLNRARSRAGRQPRAAPAPACRRAARSSA